MSKIRTQLDGAVRSELKRQWTKLFDKLEKLLRYFFKVPYDGVKNITFNIDEVNYTMRKAKVRLTWLPSPSDDVLHQFVKVVDPDDGVIFIDTKVGPEVGEVLLPELVNEKQRLQAVIVVSDGVNESDPVVVDFTVPDLTKPAPVESVLFSYEPVEVEE